MRRVRKAMGLTQADLAVRAGFGGKPFVCAIERGDLPITLLTLRRFGLAVGVRRTVDVITMLEAEET